MSHPHAQFATHHAKKILDHARTRAANVHILAQSLKNDPLARKRFAQEAAQGAVSVAFGAAVMGGMKLACASVALACAAPAGGVLAATALAAAVGRGTLLYLNRDKTKPQGFKSFLKSNALSIGLSAAAALAGGALSMHFGFMPTPQPTPDLSAQFTNMAEPYVPNNYMANTAGYPHQALEQQNYAANSLGYPHQALEQQNYAANSSGYPHQALEVPSAPPVAAANAQTAPLSPSSPLRDITTVPAADIAAGYHYYGETVVPLEEASPAAEAMPVPPPPAPAMGVDAPAAPAPAPIPTAAEVAPLAPAAAETPLTIAGICTFQEKLSGGVEFRNCTIPTVLPADSAVSIRVVDPLFGAFTTASSILPVPTTPIEIDGVKFAPNIVPQHWLSRVVPDLLARIPASLSAGRLSLD